MTRHLTALRVAIGFAWLTSCATEPEPAGNLQLAPVVVSAPTSHLLNEAAQSIASSVTGFGASYVSMSPGTEPTATSVRVRNGDATEIVNAPIIDGGFDPIAIDARPDDSLFIDVTTPEGTTHAFAKVPRRSRPVVVRTAPVHRRTDVALNPVIHVVFNEPMDAATLSGAVRLQRDGQSVAGTLTSSGSDGNVLIATFTPEGALVPNSDYELRISVDARSSSGEPLADAVVVSFTTGASTTAPPPPQNFGTIVIKTTTNGSEFQAKGYEITIDGGSPQAIGMASTLTVAGIPVGSHVVVLSGLGARCSVVGNAQREVSVVAPTPTSVSFVVSCGNPVPGPLVVITATSGPGPDGDVYRVTMNGDMWHPIGGTDTANMYGVPVGAYQVGLSGLSENCTLVGGLQPVTVVFSIPDTVAFSISCVPAPGSLVVTTSTTGSQPDPDGYELQVNGSTVRQIAPNGTVTLSNLVPGMYHLRIQGLNGNCAPVDFFPSRQVSVPAGATQTVPFEIACTPDFAPSGKLAFVRDMGGGRTAIFLANADGTGQVQLTDGSHRDQHPVWSPDGQRLAFSSDRGGSISIHTMSADGTDMTRHYAFGNDRLPSWSPDGRRIAFTRDGAIDIHIINLEDGSISAPIGPPEVWNDQASWSPNGDIAFTTDLREAEVASDVYLMSSDGSNVRPLFVGPFYPAAPAAGVPAWSADGRRIVLWLGVDDGPCFAPCLQGYNFWIAVANSDGSNLTRIALGVWGPAFDSYGKIAWSPDGAVLAYSSTSCLGAARCIRYVRAEGGGSTVTLENAHAPAWKP